jgi:hypothetical protein
MKNIVTQEIVVKEELIDSITCDVCGATYTYNDFIEYQEFFSFTQHCGYGSVFGDCNIVQLDICQNCMKYILDNKSKIKELIGKKERKFLEVTYEGKNGLDYDINKATDIFSVGEKYIVEKVNIGGHSSSFTLAGIKGEWNTVLFTPDISELIEDMDSYNLYINRKYLFNNKNN